MIVPETNEDHVEKKNEEQVTNKISIFCYLICFIQIEALRDLQTTYTHPIKCSYQTNSKRICDKKNSISILKQVRKKI
jgi:hypothetical protein